MTLCRRCQSKLEAGMERCPVCSAPFLTVVTTGPRDKGGGGHDLHDDEVDDPLPDEPLCLLLEEPLPEMAAMIREFLQNCGIRCLVMNEAIGVLYRLPTALGQTRVMVRESDLDEARELVAHFFRQS